MLLALRFFLSWKNFEFGPENHVSDAPWSINMQFSRVEYNFYYFYLSSPKMCALFNAFWAGISSLTHALLFCICHVRRCEPIGISELGKAYCFFGNLWVIWIAWLIRCFSFVWTYDILIHFFSFLLTTLLLSCCPVFFTFATHITFFYYLLNCYYIIKSNPLSLDSTVG